MENIFSCLIDAYLLNDVGIADNFLSLPLSESLRKNLIARYEDHHLLSAGIGNEVIVTQNKLIRSDLIYWLDRKHNDPVENNFFDLMDTFIEYLNRTCYTGITGYEFHYALYEKGSFYTKHIDQFKNDGDREYSMIMYLNEEWASGDGGELRIHHDNHIQDIEPSNGKGIFFKSDELEHEVLFTHKARMSITGWLKVQV